MKRALLSIFVAFLAAIAAAQYTYDASMHPGDQPANEPWAQSKMEFIAWNNERWVAWIHDGSFEQTPQNSKKWSRHSKASIAFTAWDGSSRQAKIDGDMFLIADQGNWEVTADRVDAIRYRDWSGNNQIRTVADLNR